MTAHLPDVLVGVLVAFGTVYGLTYLGFYVAVIRQLSRAVGRGDVKGDPTPVLHPFRLNALAQNPDIDYRYGAFEIPRGGGLWLRGRRDPAGVYLSIVAYDLSLQSVLPRDGGGPTFLNGEDLRLGPNGNFEVWVSGEARSGVDWIDIGDLERGVLVVRHIGGAPDAMETVTVAPLDG